VALTDIQQLTKLIKDSKHILLVFNSQDQEDALASSLALKGFLLKQQKQVDIACDGFILPKQLQFLPGTEHITAELAHLQKFTIKVDVSKTPLDSISYDVKDNWLSIYLTPKTGFITKNELRTAQSTFKYDLIITLNTPDLETLGKIFLNNSDLFYRTPIINIDFHSANEYFGQVNVVDSTATSAAEIIYQIFKQLDETLIDKTIATALLTGMIVATRSFKSSQVTPLSLTLASQLIKQGADRELIIQHLYRTRSITTLKLWGQALTHLKNDSALGLVWTTLTREDFSRSGAQNEDLRGIVDELIMNSPEAKIALLLYELDTPIPTVEGIATSEKQFSSLDILKSLNPKGNKRQAHIRIENKPLAEAEQFVIKTIKENLRTSEQTKN
jgi:phosphoesterase RecJ-like protein